jgi:hypothetical protein
MTARDALSLSKYVTHSACRRYSITHAANARCQALHYTAHTAQATITQLSTHLLLRAQLLPASQRGQRADPHHQEVAVRLLREQHEGQKRRARPAAVLLRHVAL